MTFNGICWGYVDSAQAAPYSYNAQRIIKMLNTATAGGGNLLLNIGPMPDGSVPAEAVEPLTTVGRWLAENGQAVYGKKPKSPYIWASGVAGTSFDGSSVYLWNWIWPSGGEMAVAVSWHRSVPSGCSRMAHRSSLSSAAIASCLRGGYPLYSSDEMVQYAEIESHEEGRWLHSSSSSSSDRKGLKVGNRRAAPIGSRET